MQFLIDLALTLVYFSIFLLLCAWSWRFWVMYIQQKGLNNIDWVLLEIKLPREINKSPLATEMALGVFLQGGGIGVWYKRFFLGNLPSYASLEIASLEGVVHFYIRAQRRFRPLIESNFYAQYPGVEIVEADDYTKKIRYHHLTDETSVWGGSFKPTKSWAPTDETSGKKFQGKDGGDYTMKADFIPIKTYVDYALDKDPKEEFKVDPLSPLLEVMGGIGKGEYFWYQVLIQDESVYNNKKMPKFYVNEKTHKHMNLKEMADEYKKQLRTSHFTKKGGTFVDEFGVTKKIDGPLDGEGRPTKIDAKYLETKAVSKKEIELTGEEKDEIELINKKLSKPLALVVARIVYVTKKERFNGAQISTIMTFFKPFSGRNSFGPQALADPYEFPWENFMNRRVPWRSEELFEAYVEREGYFPHVTGRDSLDKWEDSFFWTLSMKSRKTFRMIYEVIFHPFDHPSAEEAFTLNLEELATMWHLPGATASTPTLPRIDSTKGVAPVNLPL